MKNILRLLFTVSVLVSLSQIVRAEDAPVPAKPADTAKLAAADLATLKLAPIADVIKAAVAATPGKVAKVTLEPKEGAAVYAVEIPGSDKSVTVVLVDAVSGKVTGSSVEYGAKPPAAPAEKGAAPARRQRKEEGDDD